jgi:hypothetical protein
MEPKGGHTVNTLTLEERVQRLEQHNRRLRTGLLILTALLAGWVCLAATNPLVKAVKAERFEVVAPDGKVHAVLGLDDGSPSLRLLDKSGEERVSLAFAREGQQTTLMRGQRVTLAGSPELRMSHARGSWALLGIDDPGDAALRFFRRAPASPPANDEATVRRWLKLGEPLVQLAACPGTGSALTLRDSDGTGRAVLGTVGLFTTGELAIGPRPESSLVLFDKDEKVIWKAP